MEVEEIDVVEIQVAEFAKVSESSMTTSGLVTVIFDQPVLVKEDFADQNETNFVSVFTS